MNDDIRCPKLEMSRSNDSITQPLAVVDMGSNGIRFSIIASLRRHLPILYEERAPIALFDAQTTDNSEIPESTIDAVITSFRRFKILCDYYKVPTTRLIATEATRIASNSAIFQQRILDAVGWRVELLTKAQEAEISALGVIASFHELDGLAMDLGGGSVELNYVQRKLSDPSLLTSSPTPISLPYGAAALRRRLDLCNSSEDREKLHNELIGELKAARLSINIPENMAHEADCADGYTVYMSGGGFRALGYMCMADKNLNKNDTYPIPIINGYSISGADMNYLVSKYKDAQSEDLVDQLKVFRVSKRRARMIPAACFLVSALLEILPVSRILFSEGGVRQGVSFAMLSRTEKSYDPLLSGVEAYASQFPVAALPDQDFSAIYDLLQAAIPPQIFKENPILKRLLPVAIRLAPLTSHYPKESRAYAAFHTPLAGGPLTTMPGISHPERAALAIILAYRHGGDIPDPSFDAVKILVGPKPRRRACQFIGRLLQIVFTVAPVQCKRGLEEAGLKFEAKPIVEKSAITASIKEDDKQQDFTVQILLPKEPNPMVDAPSMIALIEKLTGGGGEDEEENEEEKESELLDNLHGGVSIAAKVVKQKEKTKEKKGKKDDSGIKVVLKRV